MKILTVYYSRKGENYVNGGIEVLKKGNTEIVAESIQRAVGGDLFEVETVKEYPKDYRACCQEAQKELREGVRPELKGFPAGLNECDLLFVGYPNWWGTMPMAMVALLEKYDLHGKKIVPFCTNEGSGLGSSERDLARICPGAVIVHGLSVRGSEASGSEKKVAEWAKGIVGSFEKNNG